MTDIKVAEKFTPGEKRFFMGIGAVIVAGLLTMLFVFQYSGGTPSAQTPTAPGATATVAQAGEAQQDLTGDWATVSNGVKMVATVNDSTITIVIKGTQTDITFWTGSFENSGAQGDVIASLKTANPDAIMVDGSNNMQTFMIGDRQMSFDASMMGVVKHITLTHV